MPRCYHEGNIAASGKVTALGNDATGDTEYVTGMVTRIGPKKPFRIYALQWREKKGLTQEQVAERMGTTKASISRWENNKRKPPADALSSMAHALGIEIEQLFHDPERPSVDMLLAGSSPAIRRRAMKLVQALVDDEDHDGTGTEG